MTEELKRIRYLAGCIYGDACGLTSGHVGHHRAPIMKMSEEIISIIDNNLK